MTDKRLSDTAIELWLELSLSDKDTFHKDTLILKYSKHAKADLESLIQNGHLIENQNNLIFPPRNKQVEFLISALVSPIFTRSQTHEFSFDSVKNYLISVQKQLTHFETEGKKSFLILRTMVEKIVMQAKDYLNESFQESSKKFTENNQWVNIPHVSPIGIYEPIGEIRKKFEVIMKELDISIINLVEVHLNQISDLIHPLRVTLDGFSKSENKIPIDINQINDDLHSINDLISSSKRNIQYDINKFSGEVHSAVKVQFSLLEENLGKDLIEQFDAIEQLNELKPHRIRIKLQQTINELNVHLNSIYSRLLREINTLQLHLDISKINIILTNEAGKLLKKMSDNGEIIKYKELQSIIKEIQQRADDKK